MDDLVRWDMENAISYHSPFFHEEPGIDKKEEGYYMHEQVEESFKRNGDDLQDSSVSKSIMKIQVSHDTYAEISRDSIKHNAESIASMFDEQKPKALKKQ